MGRFITPVLQKMFNYVIVKGRVTKKQNITNLEVIKKHMKQTDPNTMDVEMLLDKQKYGNDPQLKNADIMVKSFLNLTTKPVQVPQIVNPPIVGSGVDLKPLQRQISGQADMILEKLKKQNKSGSNTLKKYNIKIGSGLVEA